MRHQNRTRAYQGKSPAIIEDFWLPWPPSLAYVRRCSGRHVREFLEARADWANNLGVQREEALAITILEIRDF